MEGSYSNQVINRVENFNYKENVNNLGYEYDYNYYSDGFECYIDKNVLNFLIEKIWSLEYRFTFKHYFKYYFTAKSYSQIKLTYNMDTIFSVMDQNDTSLFSPNFRWYMGSSVWYMNFGILPHVSGDNGTEILNQARFIEMHLEYRYTAFYLGYTTYDIDQYLILNAALEIIMILIPFPSYFND